MVQHFIFQVKFVPNADTAINKGDNWIMFKFKSLLLITVIIFSVSICADEIQNQHKNILQKQKTSWLLKENHAYLTISNKFHDKVSVYYTKNAFSMYHQSLSFVVHTKGCFSVKDKNILIDIVHQTRNKILAYKINLEIADKFSMKITANKQKKNIVAVLMEHLADLIKVAQKCAKKPEKENSIAMAETFAGIDFSLLLPLVYGKIRGIDARDIYKKYSDINYNLDVILPEQANANKLDIYVPTSSLSNMPVMVYVHGGTWYKGDKKAVGYKADLFTSNGYIFISINYRLSPYPCELNNPNRLRFPCHPQDVGEALAWIYSNIAKYNGNRNKIFLIGHSAGAHLVSLVGTNQEYIARYNSTPGIIKGVCALDGAAYNIPVYFQTSAKDPHYNAFGTSAENNQDQSWIKASPVSYGSFDDSPFLLITQKGKEIRIYQNNSLANTLKSAKVLTYNKTHTGINTDVGNPADNSGMTEAIIEFFRSLAF